MNPKVLIQNAQEVTIARAIELKHNPGLISALANETTKMYTTAADSLGTLDQKVVQYVFTKHVHNSIS